MIRICPNPTSWDSVHIKLTSFAKTHPCTPSNPPVPLILAGWSHTTDNEKMLRWKATIAWAADNHCIELTSISDDDYYWSKEPTRSSDVAFGAPTYRSWYSDKQSRPAPELLLHYLTLLDSNWMDVAGAELSKVTRPLSFSGPKGRRLLVQANSQFIPPWGSWCHLSHDVSKRRTFTRFRRAINDAIAPHEVDHVAFSIEDSV